MTKSDGREIRSAEVVLPTEDMSADLAFFTESLGFRVDSVYPADDPREVVVSGHGMRVLLRRGAIGTPVTLRLTCRDSGGTDVSTAPNGTRIEFAPAQGISRPDHHSTVAFAVQRLDDTAEWITGRAGMRYRNLVRDAESFGASHIQVEAGGEVPDYVHYHEVAFQMIYCYKGWVRVVYEDQGDPLTMHEGDCVLQPPGIRHRVLECSPGLEVIEASSPAAHMTRADPDLDLPTGELRPERVFDGQRFVHHVAADAEWEPIDSGFAVRETGIVEASGGIGSVQIIRPPAKRVETDPYTVRSDVQFAFVLHGSMALHRDGEGPARLDAGDCVVVPGGDQITLAGFSSDLEFLGVSLSSLW